ncbi:MAG: HEPN domain-containing protein [Phycisphaerae bacterium]|nr:HEPN domain-containing protein [Phycisphaerae bacterium]
MLNDDRKALANDRLEQARECLDTALLVRENGLYKAAANRAYYCIFHAMRAVLAMDGFDSKKHSGVIAAFQQRNIKTGIFPPEFFDMIRGAFDTRGDSDYEDFFVISKDVVARQIENAKTFLTAVEAYLKTL